MMIYSTFVIFNFLQVDRNNYLWTYVDKSTNNQRMHNLKNSLKDDDKKVIQFFQFFCLIFFTGEQKNDYLWTNVKKL